MLVACVVHRYKGKVSFAWGGEWGLPFDRQSMKEKRENFMFLRRAFWVCTILVFLEMMLGGTFAFLPEIAEAGSFKGIPAKKIPEKRIPKIRRYYQAPAFHKRAKKIVAS